ncbi:MAG: hypothetical protein C0615_12495 [Desulfuromonas sp.]|nr:MAG: hypothetical protein C0615_12495 [Desulfuromonas sp.]
MENKRRLFIECTHTYYNGGNSGIQRVVRNLANHGLDMGGAELEIKPIIWTGFGFCSLDSKIKVKPYFFARLNRIVRRLLFHALHIHLLNPVLLKRKLAEKFGAAETISNETASDEVKSSLKLELPYFLMGLLHNPINVLRGRFVNFRRGDIVALVDSTWRSHDMLEALAEAQSEQGIQVGAMFHDLFPLLLPETCEEITRRGYVDWFKRIVPMADFFITNSEATRDSLEKYLIEHPDLREKKHQSGSFRLGAELDLVSSSNVNPGYLQPIWNTPGRAMLTVGTIEPRKNHAFLLDVYDILRQRDVNVSLIIVGRRGWKNTDIIERIERHEDFGTRLLHLANAHDNDLAETIKRADCMVCPSIAEGFGLPVVEGLMQGLEMFASEIPSFVEIGKGHCHFFDLTSPESLADQLEQWVRDKNMGVKVEKKDFQWPNWEESTKEFVQIVLSLSDKTQA